MYGGQIVHEINTPTENAHTPLIFARQALHAYEITFTHPISLEPMTLTAPLPLDMRRLWAMIKRTAGDETADESSTISLD